MTINQDKIMEELGKKYNMPKWMIEDIVKSQFRFLANTIEEGKHKGVRLHHLGVFMVKPARLKHLSEYFEKRNKNNGSTD